MLATVLLGLLYTILYCAIVIFAAFCVVWLFSFLGWTIEGNVYKWGQIIVVVICAIIIVGWLLSLLGLVGSVPITPYHSPLLQR